jgi:hypothetical protein
MRTKHAFAAALIGFAALPAWAADQDIVDTAVGAGDFTTLAAALEAADLVSTLKGEGPFTVFAPTDAAFAKLPAGTVDNLLKPENKQQLVDVLTYHVVPGKVMATDVVGLDEAPTVNGKMIDVQGRRRRGQGQRGQRHHDRRRRQQRCHPRHRPSDPAAGRLTSAKERSAASTTGSHDWQVATAAAIW